MAFAVLGRVEPSQERRVVDHASKQLAERRERALSQRVVLPLQELEVIDLQIAGGKVVVPHQRQSLLKRMGSKKATVQPPGLEPLGAIGVGGCLANDGGEGFKIVGYAGDSGLAFEQTGYGSI